MKVVEVKQVVKSVAVAAILALLSVCDAQALDDTGGSQVQLKRSGGWAAQIDQEAQEKERIEKEREEEAKRIAAEKAQKDKKRAEEKAKKAAQEKEQNAKITAEIARKKAEEAKRIAERKEWAQKEYGELMLSNCINSNSSFFQGIKQIESTLFSDPFLRVDRVSESSDSARRFAELNIEPIGDEMLIEYSCYIVTEQDISYFTLQEISNKVGKLRIMEKSSNGGSYETQYTLKEWIRQGFSVSYFCENQDSYGECVNRLRGDFMALDPDDPNTHKPFTKKGREIKLINYISNHSHHSVLRLFRTIHGTWKVRK